MQSTTLWTPSVSIAEEPVIAAATNFETAMPKFGEKRDDERAVGGGGRTHQMWITRPNAASTLSCIISLSVGCGKTVWMKSVSTSSAVLPMV